MILFKLISIPCIYRLKIGEDFTNLKTHYSLNIQLENKNRFILVGIYYIFIANIKLMDELNIFSIIVKFGYVSLSIIITII